jgi:hypothetical protein
MHVLIFKEEVAMRGCLGPHSTAAHQRDKGDRLDLTEQSLGPCADGCTTVACICKEFLLKPGIYYQNPFDSTRTTGIWCDFNQPGWYGGTLYCDGGYFDPYEGNCTAIPPTGIPPIPYKRAFSHFL